MSNRILIVSSEAADSSTLTKVLAEAHDGPFDVDVCTSLAAAINYLHARPVDALLVDMYLPDSKGIETFNKLFETVPHTPIVTLSHEKDELVAIEAVARGAQSYLTKGYFHSSLVPQSLRNIIQRKAVEQALHLEKARAEIALNSIGDAVVCADLSGNVEYLNVAAESITLWKKADAYGRPIEEVFHIISSMTREPVLSPVELVLKNGEPVKLAPNVLLIRRDGSEVPIEDSVAPIHNWDGKLTGVVIVFRDVSATQALNLKMAHLAQHDFLTNLPNRMLLSDRVAQAIEGALRRDIHVALLFLDLDNFKHINDSLGHATGDKLLKSVTHRLLACVRSSDTVSRQGGDEFVILLTGSLGEDAALTARKILKLLSVAHDIDGHDLHVTTSIGISIYPQDGDSAEALLKSADTAMYHAKEHGRNNYQFFSADMNTRAVARQYVEANLRSAYKKHEFVLHYQPKVNLMTGAITGAEALLRWRRSDGELILPEGFIPVAEESGLIVAIGGWVLREACSQAKRWMESGMPMSISVNISSLEFQQDDFIESVKYTLEETGLPPEYLELEITESVLMRDVACSGHLLRNLKRLGVKLAVDDFGTGYSSLSYLKQLPIDVLKIDQSFVSDIISPQDEGIIVSAVIGMGNSLKMGVVAEGIENHIQLAFLQAHNCEEGQGFLFGHPVSAEKFSSLLFERSPLAN